MTTADAASPVVRLHIWGVPTRSIASAVTRMGSHRAALRRMARRSDGPTFTKLLGTAKPTTFTPAASDPRHWALLSVWRSEADADAFDDSTVARSWHLIADQTLRLSMTPLASIGRWSGNEPFGHPVPRRHDGPVAAITRARVRPSKVRAFWAQSESVARAAVTAEGLVLTTGIGEAPVGLQGTFSVWSSVDAMNQFARHDPAHLEAMERTPTDGWYAEELFARFAVDSAHGSFVGMDVPALLATTTQESPS
jgi:heme-degrading monooxygenase HmoA